MLHDIEKLELMFSKGRKSIAAIGDETRQAILIALMKEPTSGMRVGEITKHTHLSQPAVSHHLKILCDANILTIRKSGTMNFYQINPDKAEVTNLANMFQGILDIMNSCEERSIDE